MDIVHRVAGDRNTANSRGLVVHLRRGALQAMTAKLIDCLADCRQ